MVMGGDLTWGDEHRILIQVMNYTTETYRISLIKFTPVNSIKIINKYINEYE